MKKVLMLLLVAVMILSMVACGQQPASTEEAAGDAEKSQDTAPADTEDAEVSTVESDDVQTSSEAEESQSDEKIKIGYIVAGPDDYYNVSASVVELQAEKFGWETIILNSEYSQEKELANAEDLITKGVDGIMILSANADSSQAACQLANEAGIPIVFVAAEPSEGEGKPDAVIAGNWSFSGDWHAKNLLEVKPDAKVALAGGVAGQSVGDLITNAFKEAASDMVVSEQYCDWNRATALEYTQNLVASGKDVNVIFAYNEDMAAGVKQALEENGYGPGEVWIISNNGKDIGVEMIEEGWLQYTIEFAPTTEAYTGILTMKAILEGNEVNAFIENPAVTISKDNIDDAITWDAEKFVNEDYQKMDLDALMDSILK